MNSLNWLGGHRFERLQRREYDWVFLFDGQASLTVSCLWRLLEAGRIKLTSADDGQQFGLPAPVDTVTVINQYLSNAFIKSIALREGTLDLRLEFGSDHSLEVLPDSSGYEAWVASNGGKQFVAVGGGEWFRLMENSANVQTSSVQ